MINRVAVLFYHWIGIANRYGADYFLYRSSLAWWTLQKNLPQSSIGESNLPGNTTLSLSLSLSLSPLSLSSLSLHSSGWIVIRPSCEAAFLVLPHYNGIIWTSFSSITISESSSVLTTPLEINDQQRTVVYMIHAHSVFETYFVVGSSRTFILDVQLLYSNYTIVV